MASIWLYSCVWQRTTTLSTSNSSTRNMPAQRGVAMDTRPIEKALKVSHKTARTIKLKIAMANQRLHLSSLAHWTTLLQPISATEPSSPLNPVVLEDVTSAKEGVVNFLGWITCTTVPCPAIQVRALVPGAKDHRSRGLPGGVIFTTHFSSRNKHPIANSITAEYHVEVTQTIYSKESYQQRKEVSSRPSPTYQVHIHW